MALSVLNLALSNSGDKKIASGVSSVTVDGTTLHFVFTNGQSADMVFPTPQDGTDGADGVSVTGVTVDENNEVTVTFSDGSEQNAGTISTKQGEKGDSGYSPTATVTQDEDGATISVTDESGTTTATVKNGKDGQADPEQIAEAVADYIAENPIKSNIESVSINGTEVTPDEKKNVNIDLATVATSGSYADLIGTPGSLSDFANDLIEVETVNIDFGTEPFS